MKKILSFTILALWLFMSGLALSCSGGGDGDSPDDDGEPLVITPSNLTLSIDVVGAVMVRVLFNVLLQQQML